MKLRPAAMRHAAVLPCLIGLALVACSSGSKARETASSVPVGPRLEPVSGTLFGVNLDFEADDAASFNQRLGHKAAVFVQFVPFPLDDAAIATLDGFIKQVKTQNGMAMITLEPNEGLAKITQEVVDDFADRVATYNERGVPVFVRFAHEMNGSWYPWSQAPTSYVQAFRLLAGAVHERASKAAMIWAPNYGGGYPFAGGQYEAKPGTPDFSLLDTTRDGKLAMDDDPYAPYYPGDDAVDWVGMSVYHWGNQYPWKENEVPEPHKFVEIISGAYAGANGDERAVPDFYDVYAAQHHKPVSITETAALYNTSLPGDEFAIKQGWWNQVFGSDVARDYPQIKMIDWFEWRKSESELGGAEVDWRAMSTPALGDAFTHALPDWLRYAP